MKTPGPYQYCGKCNRETSHSWIAETTYSCNSCGKETKVNLRKPFEKLAAIQDTVPSNLSHIDKEVLATVQQTLETVQETLEEVKEQLEDTTHQRVDMMKQGFEIKPTPLDDNLRFKTDQLGNTTVSYIPLPIEKELRLKDQKEVVAPTPLKKGWADGL